MCASYFNFLCGFVIYWKLPENFRFNYEVTTCGTYFVLAGFVGFSFAFGSDF
jgi:hypothetical protein